MLRRTRISSPTSSRAELRWTGKRWGSQGSGRPRGFLELGKNMFLQTLSQNSVSHQSQFQKARFHIVSPFPLFPFVNLPLPPKLALLPHLSQQSPAVIQNVTTSRVLEDIRMKGGAWLFLVSVRRTFGV